MWRELKKLGEKKAAHRLHGLGRGERRLLRRPRRRRPSSPAAHHHGLRSVSSTAKPTSAACSTRLGVNIEVRKTAPRADAESLYRGFTEDERAELQPQGASVLRRVPRPRFAGPSHDEGGRRRRRSRPRVGWPAGRSSITSSIAWGACVRRSKPRAKRLISRPTPRSSERPAIQQSLFEYALGLVGMKANEAWPSRACRCR